MSHLVAIWPKRTICVVVTARASYSRIRTALQAVQSHPQLELQIVAGSSAVLPRYGDARKFIRQDGFEITAEIFNLIEGESPLTSAKSTGLALIELASLFDRLRPDAVVTIADRFETLATATAAAYMNLPLVHIQGGEITGNIDEKVRHAITKLADLHLTSSEAARQRVIMMGEDPARVFATGCPSLDLAAEALKAPELTFDPFEKFGGVGARFDLAEGYLVVLQHPVTSEHAQARAQIDETLHAVHDLSLPAFWFWPNPDAGSDGVSKGIRTFREQHRPDKLYFFKHVDSLDFLRLAYNSRCVVGNSSMAIRECSFLGTPAVNIGARQAGRDRGANVVDADCDREQIKKAILRQLNHGRHPRDTLYGNGDAGTRIADLLARAPLSVDKKLHFSHAAADLSAAFSPQSQSA